MNESTPRRILIVGKESRYVKAIIQLLQDERYEVFSAETPHDATTQLADQYIDLVIIDNRFDEDDGNDDADFVKNADPSQAIILMGMALQDGLDLGRVAHNLRVFSKTRPAAELVELVEEVLHTLVPYNQDLLIEWAQGPSAAQAVIYRLEPIEASRTLNTTQLRKELEDVLRKLFWIESKIVVHTVEEGHGGSAVLKVFSTINHSVNRPAIIVKFGWREILDSELFNYRAHVEPYFYMRTTQIVGQPAYTHHLAGFKQMFVGYEQDWRPHINGNHATLDDFATVFSNQNAGALRQVVQNLFYDTYSVWFAGKQSLDKTKDEHLIKFKDTVATYEAQLGLQTERKEAIIRCNIKRLQQQAFENVVIDVAEKHITFTVDGVPEILPHPVYFWKNYSHCIPQTTLVALTHGDLNPNNIFVNPRSDSWLLDFQRTGWGPLLRDAAELESAIKFSLLELQELAQRIAFERVILQTDALSTPLRAEPLDSENVEKAQICIQTLRNEMLRVCNDPTISEYFTALFFHALKMLSFTKANATTHRPINRAHMTYSAAKIAQFLLRHHV